MSETLTPTAFHKWLMRESDGNVVKLAGLIHNEIVNNQNPQAFELLDATGDVRYDEHTFVKAAKLLNQIINKNSQ